MQQDDKDLREFVLLVGELLDLIRPDEPLLSEIREAARRLGYELDTRYA